MPRVCTICNHPNKLSIDRMLCQGKSKTLIAKEFNVPVHSLDYHSQHHISRQMAQHMAKREGIDAVGLMDELMEIVADTKNIFKRNYLKDSTSGDMTALKALDSRRATFDTILKACQLYHEAQLANLANDTEAFEQEAQAEYKAKLKLLSNDELKVLYYLQAKMNNEEVPAHMIPDVFKLPEQPAVKPIVTALTRRSPLPLPILPLSLNWPLLSQNPNLKPRACRQHPRAS